MPLAQVSLCGSKGQTGNTYVLCIFFRGSYFASAPWNFAESRSLIRLDQACMHGRASYLYSFGRKKERLVKIFLEGHHAGRGMIFHGCRLIAWERKGRRKNYFTHLWLHTHAAFREKNLALDVRENIPWAANSHSWMMMRTISILLILRTHYSTVHNAKHWPSHNRPTPPSPLVTPCTAVIALFAGLTDIRHFLYCHSKNKSMNFDRVKFQQRKKVFLIKKPYEMVNFSIMFPSPLFLFAPFCLVFPSPLYPFSLFWANNPPPTHYYIPYPLIPLSLPKKPATQ